jgi:Uma2 family endonuclease
LHGKLRGSPCRPYNSDQRIRIPSNSLATYPDVSVICGQLEPDRQDADAAINPRVLFEVLSPATEKYVRGKKFDFYRGLDSLQEYVLVSQEEPQVERFTRQEDGGWLLTVFKGLEAELDLSAIGCRLSLAEIYEDIAFGPLEVAPSTQPTMPLF